MKGTAAIRLSVISCLATTSLIFTAATTAGQGVYHLNVTQPGGMPGLPVITEIQLLTNGVRITWDGPAGYYQLYRKAGMTSQPWQPVGEPTLAHRATVTGVRSNTIFRVLGPSPQYAGSRACAECHGNIFNRQTRTPHASAFRDPAFVANGGRNNAACYPCHTVGAGLPTGFISGSDFRSTHQLAGVQCENCHGPAANHAANPDDLSVKPRKEVASTVCGGCHSIPRAPAYPEWLSSGHAVVSESGLNPETCGRCHIGPARLAMLKGEPVNPKDTELGVVCVVCHDPHGQRVHVNVLNGAVSNDWTGIVLVNNDLGARYTNNVRNPLGSIKDYFLTTSEPFLSKYDATINICAQCHNHRGANWRSTSRPPHHSPQYNILLGTVGELPTGSLTNANNHQPSSHAFLEKQCVHCHMQMTPGLEFPHSIPGTTGHRFQVETFDSCRECHPFFVEEFVSFTQGVVSDRIQQVKNALDQWALVKMGGMLGTNNYGALAWEYTNPGDLSSGRGPNAADQALIPTNIKKARFNLYLVLYDASFGVHNGYLAGTLLDAAEQWVQQEMAP